MMTESKLVALARGNDRVASALVIILPLFVFYEINIHVGHAILLRVLCMSSH